jgi:hypothetical protein
VGGNGFCVAAGTLNDAGALQCLTDRDCPEQLRCGYPLADHCAAKGVCITSNCPGSECILPSGFCGCDGQSIEVVRMTSSQIEYTSAPERGIGPCTVPDAGPSLDGGSATDATVDGL